MGSHQPKEAVLVPDKKLDCFGPSQFFSSVSVQNNLAYHLVLMSPLITRKYNVDGIHHSSQMKGGWFFQNDFLQIKLLEAMSKTRTSTYKLMESYCYAAGIKAVISEAHIKKRNKTQLFRIYLPLWGATKLRAWTFHSLRRLEATKHYKRQNKLLQM